jgi:hypothetical protein
MGYRVEMVRDHELPVGVEWAAVRLVDGVCCLVVRESKTPATDSWRKLPKDGVAEVERLMRKASQSSSRTWPIASNA